VDRSQRRELTQQMQRSTGSYELVFSTLILALIGFGLDRWLGTTPILTIVFAVLGLIGAVVKLVYGYQAEMQEHEANAVWNRPVRKEVADG
jgi:F0F1-type ATP synthase assembly protein I